MSDNYIEEVRLPAARYEAHFNFDGTAIERVLRVKGGAARRPVSQQEDALVREIIRLRCVLFRMESGGKP